MKEVAAYRAKKAEEIKKREDEQLRKAQEEAAERKRKVEQFKQQKKAKEDQQKVEASRRVEFFEKMRSQEQQKSRQGSMEPQSSQIATAAAQDNAVPKEPTVAHDEAHEVSATPIPEQQYSETDFSAAEEPTTAAQVLAQDQQIIETSSHPADAIQVGAHDNASPVEQVERIAV